MKIDPCWVGYVLLSFRYVVWVQGFPVSILTTATLDDALFWTRANNLLHGHWLGNDDNLTLAKDRASPLCWRSTILGTPITLLLALMYLFSCLLVTRTLVTLGLNRFAGFLICVMILVDPALLPTRAIRT